MNASSGTQNIPNEKMTQKYSEESCVVLRYEIATLFVYIARFKTTSFFLTTEMSSMIIEKSEAPVAMVSR